MYRRKGEEICGVLNDFDLATIKGDPSPSSKQRTGTKPYMAIQLLRETKGDPVGHSYRHDLESLFYVILILTSCFEDGKEISDPPLQKWFSLDSTTLAKFKSDLIVNRDLPALTPPYAGFIRWIEPLVFAFQDAIIWASRNTPDTETLGDNVTFAKFGDIFDVDVTSGQVATM